MKTTFEHVTPEAAQDIAVELLAYRGLFGGRQFHRVEIPGGFEIRGILLRDKEESVVFRYLVTGAVQQYDYDERLIKFNDPG
ncbi:hypothetical protein [Mucilaginibacter paludis]|uniref:Uncharacterized protein n=1 Tax=Mucilaginibacter paludis DSM 18603 TaxID=714943 RepID=H1YBW7_9SPHI|nr:hypothetical protein [Mucilaginibacter paludis]EHQ27045.1 hypothetical protein Mucpa_2937 [Mucilaginibacter paludis DSM 18603]